MHVLRCNLETGRPRPVVRHISWRRYGSSLWTAAVPCRFLADRAIPARAAEDCRTPCHRSSQSSNGWKRVLGLFPIIGTFLAASAAPLNVCCTTPDLGDLVRQVGGDEVAVTVFAKGGEDPHFVEAKPGFVKALSRADLYVETGMELEIGWAPVLLQNASNRRVLAGQPGHLDASRAIAPLEVPAGTIDRSMGDVHPAGNPHYLLDPENGLKVADAIRARLSELRPEARDGFQQRYDAFAKKVREGLERWAVELKPFAGTPVIADHNMWPYFAARFGVKVSGFLEPKPGLAPTTKHLGEIVAKMKADRVRVILASPYFDKRHARFVQEQTGCAIAELAHQVGGRKGTDDYLALCEFNVHALVEALKK